MTHLATLNQIEPQMDVDGLQVGVCKKVGRHLVQHDVYTSDILETPARYRLSQALLKPKTTHAHIRHEISLLQQTVEMEHDA